jgi:hypothetical protein
MVELLTLDPRMPVPDSLSKSDPAHPLNLLKQIKEVQAQAAKDKEFDPPLPKRLAVYETFQTEHRIQSAFFILTIGLFIAALYAMSIPMEKVVQIFLLFVGIAGLLGLYHQLA